MELTMDIRNKISSKGLKVTPQRMRVMEAVYALDNHPTADNIIEFIRKSDPNISSGTVYNVLETLVEKNLIKKVKTDKDVMRYDGCLENHHHLYCKECDYIEDYINEELDIILTDFFEKNSINNFLIDDIRVSISGNFIEHKSKNH